MKTQHLLCRLANCTVASVGLAIVLSGCGGESQSDPSFQTVIASVPLVIAPRLAASQDGSTWLLWIEGDSNTQSLNAARVDSSGSVSRTTLASQVAGALRGQQVLVDGTTPVVAWREYGNSGIFQAHAAAYINGDWKVELTVGPAVQGDVQLIPLVSGGASLVWQQIDVSGQTQLASSQRSPSGIWSQPEVIRNGPLGSTVSAPRQASGEGGSVTTLWTEAPTSVDGTLQPQVLWASQYDRANGAWGPPVTVDAGQIYYSLDIASTGNGTWLAIWLSGDPFQRTAARSKRWTNGAWDVTASRVDTGQDAQLNEVALASKNSLAYLAWIGQAADLSSGSVRAANFDAATGRWSTPSLVGASEVGYPVSLRAQTDGAGTAGAVWSVSQGSGGPFLASTDASGAWSAGSQLDLQSVGNAPDLSFFSAKDVVTTWYRPLASQNLADVVVRRLR